MDDYYFHFYGEEAGRHMAQYWRNIERAYMEMNVHAGSYYAIHHVYTPDRLRELRALVDKAERAAKGNERHLERVRMTGGGLRNAELYIELRDAINEGEIRLSKKVFDALVEHTEAAEKSGLGFHYTVSYLHRFIGRNLEAAVEAVQGDANVTVLNDEWKLEYDAEEEGLKNGYHQPDFDDRGWKTVQTFSNTLNAQGIEDRATIMWYRQQIEIPKGAKNLTLFFFENDGLSTVYLNGEEAGMGEKRRAAFSVDGTLLKPGTNSIALRLDHSKITELDLGGIIRPVYLIER